MPSEGVMTDTVTVFDDFFDREEPLHLTLEFDIKSFQRNKSQEQYVAAKLIYEANDSCHIPYRVRLKTRGTFRKAYCSLPPFWMNIHYSEINSEALEDVVKIKVVNHCMRQKFYQDFVLKEYLAYKVYNIITPYSFRVRLLRIKYVDTGRDNKTTMGWAIAIEPKELLAKRLDTRLVDNTELTMRQMEPRSMDRLAMFNYMIGNTDCSITGMHNVKILWSDSPEAAGYIPVPYDFDFTGFVHTTYSKPAAGSGLKYVTERLYTGPCREEEIFSQLVMEFAGYSDEIHDMLQMFEYMTLDKKLEMLRFLELFFDAKKSEKFVEREIAGSCTGR